MEPAPAAKGIEDHGETLTGSTGKLLESSTQYIAAHPLQSLALAFAAGYLLRRLIR